MFSQPPLFFRKITMLLPLPPFSKLFLIVYSSPPLNPYIQFSTFGSFFSHLGIGRVVPALDNLFCPTRFRETNEGLFLLFGEANILLGLFLLLFFNLSVNVVSFLHLLLTAEML